MPGRRLSGEDRGWDIVLGYHSESRIVQAAVVKLSNGVGMSRGGGRGPVRVSLAEGLEWYEICMDSGILLAASILTYDSHLRRMKIDPCIYRFSSGTCHDNTQVPDVRFPVCTSYLPTMRGTTCEIIVLDDCCDEGRSAKVPGRLRLAGWSMAQCVQPDYGASRHPLGIPRTDTSVDRCFERGLRARHERTGTANLRHRQSAQETGEGAVRSTYDSETRSWMSAPFQGPR